MLSFIARRLVSGAAMLLVITTLAFFMLYAGGGDIARRILGQQATQQQVLEKAHALGLDQPFLTQYGTWLSHALRGDLGSSWFNGQHVAVAMSSRFQVTLSMVLTATILSAVLAVVLGVWAATRRGWVDKIVQVLSLLGFAIPGFLVALALVTVFALGLHWFKPTGYVRPNIDVARWISSITLPVIALAVGGIASVTQQVRGSVIDALRQDYVRTLLSRGLSRNRVILKHVLRNAGGPALAVLAVQFIGMFGGAVIIEQIFAIPGLGQVGVSATTQGDIPLVMGLVLVTAALVVVVNLAIDLLQGWLNPKVRLS